jgi:hypothetical protein
VRLARSLEARALNRIFRRDAIIGMKNRILSLVPLNDEVRDRIDTMSHNELGLWIHHHEIAEAEQAKAKRLLEKGADTKFLSRVDELKAFKEMHGHLNVRSNEDMSLYDFCKKVRYSDKLSSLGKARYITHLMIIG